MDPFTIHCSSCQSRIRVRNPNMIGQIANCPKCGSMILIAAPQQSVVAPQQILVDSARGSVTDSVAVTKEALPVPDEGLFGELHTGALEQGFDQTFRDEGLPEAASVEPAALESLSPSNWMPEPTPPPRADEIVDSVSSPSNSRQILLVAAIGLCSVLLACGMFIAFLRWYARPTAVAVNRTGAEQSANTANTGGADASLTATANASEHLDDPTQFETIAGEQAASVDSASSEFQALEQTGSPEAGSPDATNPEASGAQGNSDESNPANPDRVNGAGAPVTSVANNVPASSGAASGAPSGAPLGLQHTPDIDSTFALPEEDANAQAVKEALPPGLQNFASIFDQALVPVLSDATVPLAAAPEAGDDPAAGADVASAAPMALNLPETVEQKQAIALGGLLIQNRPLSEALSTLSVASDIPFTADLDSLLAAGVDRDQPINFRSATSVSVMDVMNTLARDYNLSFEPYEKKLFIVRGPMQAVQSRVPTTLPIADLVSGAEQSAALRAALSELLPELADGFQLADGTAQADLEKVNHLLWFQVARLLHSWRTARGLENADAAQLIPQSSLLPAWPVEAAHKLAQTKISQTLLPEPLAINWHRLASEAGITCWVDWPSLASAQASPAQIGMSVSHGRPLQELLQHDADKYQVVFALEDEKTLWITSPDMHRFQPRLYVLPMADKTIEQWRTELELLTPFNPDGSEALKVVAAPDGQFIFVRCCRPVLAEPQL